MFLTSVLHTIVLQPKSFLTAFCRVCSVIQTSQAFINREIFTEIKIHTIMEFLKEVGCTRLLSFIQLLNTNASHFVDFKIK